MSVKIPNDLVTIFAPPACETAFTIPKTAMHVAPKAQKVEFRGTGAEVGLSVSAGLLLYRANCVVLLPVQPGAGG